jgi:hypothetical protein
MSWRDRYARLQGLLNTPMNQGGGLLGNIPQGAILGASLYGQGIQGKDPFASLLPAYTQTAQLQKLMTPKKGPKKRAYDPKTKTVVFADDITIEREGYVPEPKDPMVTRFNSNTGQFEMIPSSMLKGKDQNQDKSNEILNANKTLNFVGNRLMEQIQEAPTGATGFIVSSLEGMGDQLAQATEQLGIRERYKPEDTEFIDSIITKATGLKKDAANYQRIKTNIINMAYLLARNAEPGNSRFSDKDIGLQIQRMGIGQSRNKAIAGLTEILTTENQNAQYRYETLNPGSELPSYKKQNKKKKEFGTDSNPMGLDLN